ncbi:MAG: TonB-dependent receptor [Trichlorobacter sp.]|nr:TonB-dependent receptor [Trichlorobacter sp.]
MKRSRQKRTCSMALGMVMGLCAVAGAEEQDKSTDIRLEQVVVTANRMETQLKEVGSSITVITAEEIEARQQPLLLDVLRSVPSVDVVRTGTMGGTTSISIRGAGSNKTLVLLDGIELGDPSSTGGEYDFANLTTDNIERIEILRGPQSTLYGSRAMGGVINIITKRGQGKPTGYLSLLGGSFYTASEKAGIMGGSDKYNYSLGVSRFDTSGYSSANSKYGNSEKDGYQNTSINTRLGITPMDNLSVDFIINYLRSRAELDGGGGPGYDDPNSIQKTEQVSFRTQADLDLFDKLWEQRLGVSFNDLTRDLKNDPDPAHPSDLSRGHFHGQSVMVDWQHTLNLHKTNTLTLGVERKEENAKSDYYSESVWGPLSSPWKEHFAHTTGFYLQDQVKLWDSWFTTLGVRLDDHSKFDSKTTYRFTSAYVVKQTGTTFKGSYGTAFKAPSLYQLYAPTYGNTKLKPETSNGWDLGIEQSLLKDRLTFGATYFHNDFENLIIWDNTYSNLNKARTQGVELMANARPFDDLTLTAGYTYTKVEDRTTGQAPVRIPKNKISFDANYRFLKNANANLGVVYVSSRNDNFYDAVTFAKTPVKVKNYVLVNLAAAYDITKNIQIFGRVDNLFDRDYEEVYGYGTAGISGYGGIKLSF